jgi:hypothetical protein
MPLQRGHLRAKVIHDRLAVSEDGLKDLLLVLMRAGFKFSVVSAQSFGRSTSLP